MTTTTTGKLGKLLRVPQQELQMTEDVFRAVREPFEAMKVQAYDEYIANLQTPNLSEQARIALRAEYDTRIRKLFIMLKEKAESGIAVKGSHKAWGNIEEVEDSGQMQTVEEQPILDKMRHNSEGCVDSFKMVGASTAKPRRPSAERSNTAAATRRRWIPPVIAVDPLAEQPRVPSASPISSSTRSRPAAPTPRRWKPPYVSLFDPFITPRLSNIGVPTELPRAPLPSDAALQPPILPRLRRRSDEEESVDHQRWMPSKIDGPPLSSTKSGAERLTISFAKGSDPADSTSSNSVKDTKNESGVVPSTNTVQIKKQTRSYSYNTEFVNSTQTASRDPQASSRDSESKHVIWVPAVTDLELVRRSQAASRDPASSRDTVTSESKHVIWIPGATAMGQRLDLPSNTNDGSSGLAEANPPVSPDHQTRSPEDHPDSPSRGTLPHQPLSSIHSSDQPLQKVLGLVKSDHREIISTADSRKQTHVIQHSQEINLEVPPCEPGPDNSILFGASDELARPGQSLHQSMRDITKDVERVGEYPYTSGGFGDIWKGKWRKSGQSNEVSVAIKVLRAQQASMIMEMKLDKRLRRELRIWQHLAHPNILQLCGVVVGFGPQPSFVCPWMESGCLTEFLKQQHEVLSLPQRLRLLSDIINGLWYLHKSHIVHGDLTGANVLIHADGHALLSDFGLSDIIAEVKSATFVTSTIAGNLRWAAPELVALPSDEHEFVRQVTFQSDIYSFGCIMLETLTGKVPYHYLWNDAQVLISVNQGIKPRRPVDASVTDELWNLMNQCWTPSGERPSAGFVHDRIQTIRENNTINGKKESSWVALVQHSTAVIT